MKKKGSKLVAWRLSAQARQAVEDIAEKTGMPKTQVVELCIAKHALETLELAEGAKQSLLEFVTDHISRGEHKHGE